MIPVARKLWLPSLVAMPAAAAPSGKQSKRLPATGIVFRETTADYENSWHRAPRRQYVISLAGGISITASDGETRQLRRDHGEEQAASFSRQAARLAERSGAAQEPGW